MFGFPFLTSIVLVLGAIVLVSLVVHRGVHARNPDQKHEGP